MVLVNNPGTWSAVYRPLTHAEWQAAALGLAACAWLVDVAGYRRWTGPFVLYRALYIAACLAPPNALLSASPVRSFDGGEALTDRRDP